MRAGELDADAGTAEERDRLAIEIVGKVALAEQSADARFDSLGPRARCHARTFGEPRECGLEQRHVTGPGRRLGQLGHDKRPEPDLITLERSHCCVARGVVAAKAVVQNRARVVGDGDEPAETACARLLHRGLDQLQGPKLLASPGRERRSCRRGRARPGSNRDGRPRQTRCRRNRRAGQRRSTVA